MKYKIRNYLLILLAIIYIIASIYNIFKLINNQYDIFNIGETQEEVLRELLIENGVDTSILDEKSETPGGGTILGGAKPAQSFRTLRDGEIYYGSYFGFHNTIDSLPEYSLVALYCINDEFLQGVYETDNESNTVVVKYSNSIGTDKLREAYNIREYSEVLKLDGIDIYIEGDGKDTINLILIEYRNGKSYSIYSAGGFSRKTSLDIANELNLNIKSMSDY